jgi:hypothetical protein
MQRWKAVFAAGVHHPVMGVTNEVHSPSSGEITARIPRSLGNGEGSANPCEDNRLARLGLFSNTVVILPTCSAVKRFMHASSV